MPPAPDQGTRPVDLHLAFTATPLGVRDNLRRMLTLPPLARLSDDRRGTAEVVLAPDAPASAATPEETDKILRWLEQPGVRIVDIVGQ